VASTLVFNETKPLARRHSIRDSCRRDESGKVETGQQALRSTAGLLSHYYPCSSSTWVGTSGQLSGVRATEDASSNRQTHA